MNENDRKKGPGRSKTTTEDLLQLLFLKFSGYQSLDHYPLLLFLFSFFYFHTERIRVTTLYKSKKIDQFHLYKQNRKLNQ